MGGNKQGTKHEMKVRQQDNRKEESREGRKEDVS